MNLIFDISAKCQIDLINRRINLDEFILFAINCQDFIVLSQRKEDFYDGKRFSLKKDNNTKDCCLEAVLNQPLNKVITSSIRPSTAFPSGLIDTSQSFP